MPTLEDVVRGALGLIDSDEDYILALRWAANRYKELAARVRYRHLRQTGQLLMPGALTTGTVSVTQGTNVVTGSSAAQESWLQPSVAGRWIKIATNWYQIDALIQGELRLASIYTEASVTDGAYQIVQRFLPLDPAVRHIGDVMFMKRRWRLKNMSASELDTVAPGRRRLSSAPCVWAEHGVGLDGDGQVVRLIECYPYVRENETIHYTYWAEPADLQGADELPKGIDEHVLREGLLVDLYRHEMAKALKSGRVDAAAVWRNDYRAQNTTWEHKIMEAVKSDRGKDDLTGILEEPNRYILEREVYDAHTYVYDRWPI